VSIVFGSILSSDIILLEVLFSSIKHSVWDIEGAIFSWVFPTSSSGFSWLAMDWMHHHSGVDRFL
jgi:hypothetical protein